MDNNITLNELRKFVAPEFVFGLNARFSAGKYCKQFGAVKVLLVTDKTVEIQPWFKDIAMSITEQGIDFVIYSEVTQNPRDYEVMKGAEKFAQAKCNIILALGGGSVIDCAKGIGIVASNKKHISKYEGVDKILNPMPPLVCVPTTSGSSADVSQFAIINNTTLRYKMAIISKAAVPDISLIDPFVLTTMDPFLTACTGMDAITHAMESYVSNASSSITDIWAFKAMELLFENLQNAVNNPQNLEIREKTMLGSLYAGLAFSNASLGVVHSMAHSLGGYLDLPHGECNAILLPHVVGYNYESNTMKYNEIAQLIGIDYKHSNPKDVCRKMVQSLVDFRKSVNIASNLKAKGVNKDIIKVLSAKAIKDPCNATNPRIPLLDDLSVIYAEAL